ncbi:BRCA1-associated RING domain protein 1 [Hyperolius riggenbachi]|uniref:BRCA1-associated RING domain protein 1 n=1 Tax=Hyperolius riggenbachi TaxID=752182 RepID=UPI0035A3069F
MPLRVRSGNRPPDRRDSAIMAKQPGEWSRTRAALQELEERLLCSVCSSTLKQPICLGGCEHVFCRTCVGDSVGNECPVCHTPAWVKDVQINRQLDNIIQLCGKLNSLLGKGTQDENKMDLCQEAPLRLNTTEEECKKRQIKMWFSPRRGKVRYVLQKDEVSQQNTSKHEEIVDSYEFVSSSPTVEPVKKKNNSKSKKSKKKKLEDLNQIWGVGVKGQASDNLKKSEASKSARSVSFCSTPVVLPASDTEQENHDQCGSPMKSAQKKDSGLKEHAEVEKINNITVSEVDLEKPLDSLAVCNSVLSKSPEQERYLTDNLLDESNSCNNEEAEAVEGQAGNKSFRKLRQRNSPFKSPKNEKKSLKRKDCPTVSPVSTTLKRPRNGLADVSKSEEPSCAHSRKDKKDARSDQLDTSSKSPSTPSHNKSGRRTSQTGASNQTSPSNFSVNKKNIKGETLLHVASIKGDLKGVVELLKNGANPNVKDNAGWTPLHEACNHGHSHVVELLLQHQALVNTTGYQNDTPLHDAAKNGHVAIVRLLLKHGAFPDAVNIFGRRPVDYAETEEIKLALLQAQTHKEPLVKQPCYALNKGQCREGAVVLLASGLPASQKTDLAKLTALLKAEICSNYNSAVTHVIVGDDPMLRTMKCMMGTLAGCWILRSTWVKACLESSGREAEELHEVQGGPHRARLNREQLLPRLLDGCHFYFLGLFKEHKKEDLTELVKVAGGQVLIRQPKPDSDVTQTINTVAYHAKADSDQRFCTQYIIYDKASKYVPGKIRQGKVWFAPSSWLIDCITCFQLLPVPE